MAWHGATLRHVEIHLNTFTYTQGPCQIRPGLLEKDHLPGLQGGCSTKDMAGTFFTFFWSMQKIIPDGPKWGREVLFPANPDLADILGDMDSDFENFHC